MSKYLVLGDGGHAEKVAGKCAPDKSLYEWKFNQEVDTKMKKRCADHGIDYYQTNPSPAGKDEMGLSKRAELANAHWKKQGKPKALFISYHANAYKSVFNDARGTETYVASNASTNSKNAAKFINDEIYSAFKKLDNGAKNRGVKTEDFTVIYKAQMPSILVEYGFYTNKADIKILKNNVDELVEATMKGVCKYFGITYKAPKKENNTSKETTYYRVATNSYLDRNYAEKEVEELKKLGVSAFLDGFKKDNKTYLRVIAGSYTDRKNADTQIAALKKKGYAPFIVIYIK
ncbi:N-acetylmuramoyl-L-alanine amidase LytC precursor [uncultured Clostridium sp.]|nr:N-acetylmuramoyl-L-alanine amidase LytC precursor [uncultured Clostridium sp.]